MASIRERTSKAGATTYAVLYREEGRQRSKTFTTMKAAERFAALVDAVGPTDAVDIGLTRQAGHGPTVADLFVDWLEVKRADMTVEGHRDYVRSYEKWIAPSFGWRDAELVTERDVQAWIDDTLRETLAPKSVAKQHALLHGMYRWASSKTVGRCVNNPCTETRLPKRRKSPPRGLTVPELHQMMAARDVGSPDAADVIAVMAGTGWRPGEVLGLTAGAVDVMPSGAVYATVETVYRRGEGIVYGGKTEAAGRRLLVVGEGAQVLARRVVGRGVSDLVFPHPNPGRGRGVAVDERGRVLVKPWPPSSFAKHYWPKVVEAAGLVERAPTPYWLRHTHVALCVAAGMSLPEIQRRVGHESIQTTIDVYGRLIDGMSEESAGRLEALLAPTPGVVAGEVV